MDGQYIASRLRGQCNAASSVRIIELRQLNSSIGVNGVDLTLGIPDALCNPAYDCDDLTLAESRDVGFPRQWYGPQSNRIVRAITSTRTSVGLFFFTSFDDSLFPRFDLLNACRKVGTSQQPERKARVVRLGPDGRTCRKAVGGPPFRTCECDWRPALTP